MKPSRILMLCALALLVWGASAAPARAESPSGAVYLTTLPAGAEVWVDGVYVGQSPVLIGALVAGRHAFTLTKSGWNVRELTVDVAASTTTMSSVALETAPARSGATGSVTVRGLPDGAKLAIDGRDVVPNQSLELAAGAHKAQLALPHGVRATRDFTVVADTASVLVMREPKPVERSGVVGLADDYVPGSYVVDKGRVTIRYEGHTVLARLGDPVVHYDGSAITYDSPPETIGGKLYLPLDVLVRLTGGSDPDDGATATPRPRTSPAPAAH